MKKIICALMVLSMICTGCQKKEEVQPQTTVEPTINDDYVSFTMTGTPYGYMNIPTLNYARLDEEQAKGVNQLLQDYLHDYVDTYGQTDVKGNEQNCLMESKSAIEDGILSLLIMTNDPYGDNGTNYESFNFDLETGRLITAEEVLNRSGYTLEQAADSVGQFTLLTLQAAHRHNNLGKQDDGMVDWLSCIENAQLSFLNSAINFNPDIYPDMRRPVVYKDGNGKVLVAAHIEDNDEMGRSDPLLIVGHNAYEVEYENKAMHSLLKYEPLSEPAARDAIIYNDPQAKDTSLTFTQMSESTDGSLGYELLYNFHNDKDEYTVGSLSGIVCRRNGEEWEELIPTGSPMSDEIDVSTDAKVVIYHDPSEYERWMNMPAFTADLRTGDNGHGFLYYCTADKGTVEFEGNTFDMTYGQCIYFIYDRNASAHITLTTDEGSIDYTVNSSSAKIEYLK